MSISLHEFCKTHNLAKSSVWNRCKELGIETAGGLDLAAQETLRSEFQVNEKPQPPAPPEGTEQPKAGAMILSTGRSLPALPGQFLAPEVVVDLGDLEDLQSEGAKLANASAQQVGNFLTQYAHLRLQQSLQRIDSEFAALEGQALNQAVGKLAG